MTPTTPTSPTSSPTAAISPGPLADLDAALIPAHIAVIMDGNGRWATQRGFDRVFGHRNGAAAARSTIEACSDLGVKHLTLYSFSLENWKRPEAEIKALMDLCAMYIDGQREALAKSNIRFRMIGRRERLPREVLESVDRLTAATAGCTGLTLVVALNYGSRGEILDAARALARKAAAGEINPDRIDEAAFASHLFTAGLPDPDLLIRTGGQMRLSNFLLWQLSYAELYITETLWPDFSPAHLHEAIRDYAGRKRRFGGLDAAPEHPLGS